MNTFMDLYRYECKKIWSRNLTKASFAICLVIGIISGIIPLCGSCVVDGEVVGTVYDEFQLDRLMRKNSAAEESISIF